MSPLKSQISNLESLPHSRALDFSHHPDSPAACRPRLLRWLRRRRKRESLLGFRLTLYHGTTFIVRIGTSGRTLLCASDSLPEQRESRSKRYVSTNAADSSSSPAACPQAIGTIPQALSELLPSSSEIKSSASL